MAAEAAEETQLLSAVLLIEDDAVTLENYGELLGRSGIAHKSTRSGAEGLGKAPSQQRHRRLTRPATRWPWSTAARFEERAPMAGLGRFRAVERNDEASLVAKSASCHCDMTNRQRHPETAICATYGRPAHRLAAGR